MWKLVSTRFITFETSTGRLATAPTKSKGGDLNHGPGGEGVLFGRKLGYNCTDTYELKQNHWDQTVYNQAI